MVDQVSFFFAGEAHRLDRQHVVGDLPQQHTAFVGRVGLGQDVGAAGGLRLELVFDALAECVDCEETSAGGAPRKPGFALRVAVVLWRDGFFLRMVCGVMPCSSL